MQVGFNNKTNYLHNERYKGVTTVLRVIVGEARGRRLEALPERMLPVPHFPRSREAMFSIVQFRLPGARVLDLFAGSGQLGIEALSRVRPGAFWMRAGEAINVVMRNCKACGVFDRSRVSLGEAARYLSACREQFDLVLLDFPPFRSEKLELSAAFGGKMPGARRQVLCESETGLVPACSGGADDPAAPI